MQTLLESLRERFSQHPLHQFLGITLVDLEFDRCTVEAVIARSTDNGSGTIHGGVIAILADVAVAGALATNFDGKMGFATSNLSLHYLRRARDLARATAVILKKGSKVCVASVEVYDGRGILCATAMSDYVLTTAKFGERPRTE
ncbi:MAG: PaaI family thioesterase [Thermoanaerobaculia bacterium]